MVNLQMGLVIRKIKVGVGDKNYLSTDSDPEITEISGCGDKCSPLWIFTLSSKAEFQSPYPVSPA